MHRAGTQDSIDSSRAIPYHVHPFGYIAVVLSGNYRESSDSGRVQVSEGDVVYHPPFQAHFDRAGPKGARVLNLYVGLHGSSAGWLGSVPDLSLLVRSSQRSPADALACLRESVRVREPRRLDWQDQLAWGLVHGVVDDLGVWASSRGLCRESVSRGFKRAYGASPIRFRADVRARRAWADIVSTKTSLVCLAAQHGYADQAHMTHAINALTMRTPGAWRSRIPRDADGHQRDAPP